MVIHLLTLDVKDVRDSSSNHLPCCDHVVEFCVSVPMNDPISLGFLHLVDLFLISKSFKFLSNPNFFPAILNRF